MKKIFLGIAKVTIRPLIDLINNWQDKRFDELEEKHRNNKQNVLKPPD